MSLLLCWREIHWDFFGNLLVQNGIRKNMDNLCVPVGALCWGRPLQLCGKIGKTGNAFAGAALLRTRIIGVSACRATTGCGHTCFGPSMDTSPQSRLESATGALSRSGWILRGSRGVSFCCLRTILPSSIIPILLEGGWEWTRINVSFGIMI